MDDIHNKLVELLNGFKMNPQYHIYLDAKLKIEDNPELQTKLTEFKKAAYELESVKMQGNMPEFEQERYVSKLYSEVLLYDEGRLYLESEKVLCDILHGMYEYIAANCGIKPGLIN